MDVAVGVFCTSGVVLARGVGFCSQMLTLTQSETPVFGLIHVGSVRHFVGLPDAGVLILVLEDHADFSDSFVLRPTAVVCITIDVLHFTLVMS